jgi:thiol-disulfide isomerase/thioredoxin
MGVYPVSLRVTDGEGATDVIDAPITVNVLDNPPTACAEIKTTWPYFWNTNIQFSGECSSDIDGTIISWEWDLGADGSYEQSGETAVFNFPTAGAYQMQLRVTDNDGGTALLDTPLSFQIYDDSNWPPIVTKVNHSRTTSTMGSATETVTLGVDFDDPVPPGDTHTYLWSCPYGAFDDPTSATPVWTPPNQVVKCQITVRVIDSFGMWDEGTCNQWVTQWPILFNPYAPGNIIYSQSLDTADDGFVNPSTYKFPDVQPDGNVIYCNFWATWCGPCMNEMPDLSTIYDMYKDQQYAHLLIDVGESKQTVVNFVNSHNYHATHWPLDPGNAYYSIMVYWTTNPGYIPTSLVFDRDGYCRAQYVGTIPSISTLTQYIDELI